MMHVYSKHMIQGLKITTCARIAYYNYLIKTFCSVWNIPYFDSIVYSFQFLCALSDKIDCSFVKNQSKNECISCLFINMRFKMEHKWEMEKNLQTNYN